MRPNITKSKCLVEKGLNYVTNLVTRNALKLTYGDVEMQKLSGGITPDPRSMWPRLTPAGAVGPMWRRSGKERREGKEKGSVR